ncbi:MAG: hypothetical protein M0P97_00175 [Candidatus Moranbacteria bacterium]|jgi:hypothetical protein|nr:hypothetical protein [Candidatus Moranbacteria bacterium]
METVMKADIFFFISSVASIILAVLFSVFLFYLIKAGKNFYLISEKLLIHFKASEEFAAEIKERLESNLIFRLFFPPARKRSSGKKKEEK